MFQAHWLEARRRVAVVFPCQAVKTQARRMLRGGDITTHTIPTNRRTNSDTATMKRLRKVKCLKRRRRVVR